MLVSTYKHWIKNISLCSLKYEDPKNEDCSLTYPNIKKNERKSTWCQVYAPYNSTQMPENLAGSVIDRQKSTLRKSVHSYNFFVVMCK